jgi:pimeloyl-ACP methyl ester carboxylesterase
MPSTDESDAMRKTEVGAQGQPGPATQRSDTMKERLIRVSTMMNRRTLIGAAAASVVFPLLNRIAIAQTSLKTTNVVFVHGLFADGSCWSKVIARLQKEGVNCTSVQNPLTSLQEASEAARRAIALQPGPAVLVGHSYSGMIVSEVGVDPKITALVYVAARAPDAGEDYTALAKKYPTPPASAGIVFNDDWGQLSEEAFLHDFAGDLPPDEARVLYAVQQPFKKSLTADRTTNAAWRSKPSFYAVSIQDRTINPDLERFMAKRMGAKTIEIEASHLGLISHSDAIANLILQALAV